MRRTFLLLTVAAMLATMLLTLAGPSLAKDPEQKQETYADNVELKQYFAKRLSVDDRQSWFRGLVTDIEGDRYPTSGGPGLEGALDTNVIYGNGAPTPGGLNELKGGEWWLCSEGFDPDPLGETGTPILDETGIPIKPECEDEETTSDSEQVSLTGTWKDGTAQWNEGAGYSSCPPGPIYGGVAEVEGTLSVKGGTVYGKPVTEGSGKFKGTLDHTPLLLLPCTVEYPPGSGNQVPNPARAPIVTGTMKLILR